MADFNLLIRERLFTDSNPRGGDLNITIKDISYSDNRVLRIPSGSESTLFDLSNPSNLPSNLITLTGPLTYNFFLLF